ncbi:MAG TPA: CBS domain-containing protein [Verrucomicrobiae bacterium]|jgi:CBS domain-containing protein|nr:CBS domain-containing protein [Verrucomicrobiae bacterium]
MNLESLRAADIMNRNVKSVPNDMKLKDLMQFLMERHITGVPVMDSQEKFVGVVSTTDVLRVMTLQIMLKEEDMQVDLQAVGDKPISAMSMISRPLFNFREEDKLYPIARLMTEKGIHRVFVVDDNEALKGVISSMDFVRLAETATKPA